MPRPHTIAWLDCDRLIHEIIDRPYATVALWWNSLAAILRERVASIGRRDVYARVAHLRCETFEQLRLVGETVVDHTYMLPIT